MSLLESITQISEAAGRKLRGKVDFFVIRGVEKRLYLLH